MNITTIPPEREPSPEAVHFMNDFNGRVISFQKRESTWLEREAELSAAAIDKPSAKAIEALRHHRAGRAELLKLEISLLKELAETWPELRQRSRVAYNAKARADYDAKLKEIYAGLDALGFQSLGDKPGYCVYRLAHNNHRGLVAAGMIVQEATKASREPMYTGNIEDLIANLQSELSRAIAA